MAVGFERNVNEYVKDSENTRRTLKKVVICFIGTQFPRAHLNKNNFPSTNSVLQFLFNV